MAFVHVPHQRRHDLEDRRRILQAFRAARAVSAGSARTASEMALGALEQAKMFAQLRDREILRSLPGNRFYLDEDRLKDVNVLAARIGLTVAFVIFLVIIVVVALNG